MEPQNKTTAKDFFLNLGAIVALYVIVITLLNLLFTVINKAYPLINNGYNYFGSQSISWPVAILIIFFPIFVFLMWLLERGYALEPEKRKIAIKRWLTYITLFLAGLAVAIDLVTVLYYFIDGQELTTGFVMKVLVVLVVTLCVFMYYISEIREKLNSASRKIWLGVAVFVIGASIVWGFSVLGSPRTQRLIKYDQQKVSDLMNINSVIISSYSEKGILPEKLADVNSYYTPVVDSQAQKPYEYKKTDKLTYELCAEFNKSSNEVDNYSTYKSNANDVIWTHPAGYYCFKQTINPNSYYKSVPVPVFPVQ